MNKKYLCGVDIGGTTVKIGIFTKEGELLKKWEITTDTSNDGANILPDIGASLDATFTEMKIEKEQVIGVGMGVPGPVDASGVLNKAVNLGWGVFNIEKESEKIFGLTVKAGNDASVATLGEMWQGAGKGYKDLVMLTLGTGVGGGVVVDEKIVTGAVGGSGEVGHIAVNFSEQNTCGCGKKGCLEQYASATGIVNNFKRFKELGEIETEITLENPSAKDIIDGAKNGDKLCNAVVEETGRMLGIALSYIGCICDPEVFVIGGGVSKAGDIIITPMEKYYKQYVFHSAVNTKIILATLGNDAGIYGAARQLL